MEVDVQRSQYLTARGRDFAYWLAGSICGLLVAYSADSFVNLRPWRALAATTVAIIIANVCERVSQSSALAEPREPESGSESRPPL